MILSLRNWCGSNDIFVVQKAYNYEDLVAGAVLIVVIMQCCFN